MRSTLIFTATYNEADNIRALMADIWSHSSDSDILVVDDNSPDGTGAILDDIQKRSDGKLQVIHRPRKLGLGNAHKLAMKYAVENGYDYLITMDADFSHNPKYIPTIIGLLDSNDFVIGSRYVEGGRCDYGQARLLLSKIANFLTKTLLEIKLEETTTSFRGFNRSLIEKLDIDGIKSDGYSFFVEVIYQVSNFSTKLREFPIHFEDRRHGTTKISKLEIIRGVQALARIFFRRVFNVAICREEAFENCEELINCNVCDSPHHIVIYPSTSTSTFHKSEQYYSTSAHHSSHGRIVRCLTCDMVYTNPMPPKEVIDQMYVDVEDTAYLSNFDARLSTFKYNLDKIKKHLSAGARLLDVGSYYGAFLKVADERGYDVTGLEPSSRATKYTNEKLNLKAINGTLSDLPASGGDFDVITSWDVLEHFTDPMKELRLMASQLKPGGVLAFSTLNIKNWFPKLIGERWPWYMDMHLYYFNEHVIEDMLQRSGFELISVQKYCHIISVDYFLRKLGSLGVPGTSLLRNSPLKPLFEKIQIPFRFGDIQLFVCKKLDVQGDRKRVVSLKPVVFWVPRRGENSMYRTSITPLLAMISNNVTR